MSTDVGTQTRLDAAHGVKNKAKVEKGLLTVADVARENHKDKLQYEVTILNDEQPFASISTKSGHFQVNFLDGAMRNYLSFLFSPAIKHRDQLFVREIWYYNFTSEKDENETYRLHFIFEEDGNLRYKRYDDENEKMQEFEGKEKFEVSDLYEPYPEFGKYEGIMRLKRKFHIDIFPLT